MNGLHDLGGMHGFGSVAPAKKEAALASDGERRMFGLTMGLIGTGWCDPEGFRFAVERLPPEMYARDVAWANWLAAAETQLIENGLLQVGELDAWIAGDERATQAATAPPVLFPERFEPEVPARFRRGDHVRTRMINPAGHTRLPRYLRGRRGVVETAHGVYNFSDTMAARTGRRPQTLYLVCFSAREVWGDDAGERDAVYADLFDDYLTQTVETPS